MAAQEHGLEEARGLGHLPAAGLDRAGAVNFDHDVAVTFDPGKVMDVNGFGPWGSEFGMFRGTHDWTSLAKAYKGALVAPR